MSSRALQPSPYKRAAQRPYWGLGVEDGLECLFFAFLVGVVILCNFGPVVPTTPFVERDPQISYPLTRPETVSNTNLMLISIVAPALILLATLVVDLTARSSGGSDTPSPSSSAPSVPPRLDKRAVLLAYVSLAFSFAQALILNECVSDVIKAGVGRLRPNFFALCDYAGYRDAAASGNLTSYLSTTTPGAFGSLSRCSPNTAPSDLVNAQKSFPSGHAALSAAAMVWFAAFLRHRFRSSNAFDWRSLFTTFAPLAVAGFIAASRVRDHWHFTDDVVLGAIVGTLSSLCAWHHLRRSGRAALFFSDLATWPCAPSAAHPGDHQLEGELEAPYEGVSTTAMMIADDAHDVERGLGFAVAAGAKSLGAHLRSGAAAAPAAVAPAPTAAAAVTTSAIYEAPPEVGLK